MEIKKKEKRRVGELRTCEKRGKRRELRKGGDEKRMGKKKWRNEIAGERCFEGRDAMGRNIEKKEGQLLKRKN